MKSAKRVFSRKDEGVNEPLHYKTCGLDDIYLVNGYSVEETAYGRGIAIHDIDDLHQAIALRIVSEKKRLNGKEFRFLRKQMDMTQAELGIRLGVDAQTVARYEKGESTIHGSADNLIRFVVCLSVLPEAQKLKLLGRIEDLIVADGPNDPMPAYFRSSPRGWLEQHG
jgi:DNA-binding transcriptional regulator YiaG